MQMAWVGRGAPLQSPLLLLLYCSARTGEQGAQKVFPPLECWAWSCFYWWGSRVNIEQDWNRWGCVKPSPQLWMQPETILLVVSLTRLEQTRRSYALVTNPRRAVASWLVIWWERERFEMILDPMRVRATNCSLCLFICRLLIRWSRRRRGRVEQ